MAMVFWWMAGFDMDAKPIWGIEESTSTATEVSKHSVVPRGGCSSKCVAQTQPFSKEADHIGIVSKVQREKSA